jgi:hypothetical protein
VEANKRKGIVLNLIEKQKTKSKEETEMKRKLDVIRRTVAFAVGMALLALTVLLGVSNVYATPDRKKNCAACHTSRGSSKGFTDSFMLEECHGFSSTGSNPYFVLEPNYQLVLEGKEKKRNAHLTITVLNETNTIKVDIGGVATDVETRVVEERETWDGVLAEVSRNYFAICDRTNSVFYFGEDVDIYDATGTIIVSHDGSWLAAPDGPKPGIAMSGVILLGGKYFQEVAPGVAMDRAEIISMKEVVETPGGTFENCLKTRETSSLEPGKAPKFYAPGIGLIKDGNLELTEYPIP